MKKMERFTHLLYCHQGKCMRINWSLRRPKKLNKNLRQKNGEDVRLSENKVSHERETIGGKVWAIRNRFEDFKKNKKKHGKGWEWRVNEWREEEYVEKLGKHLNFYAKQSDLTHAYHSNIPMILLLWGIF